jgi:hypothetical protein
MQQSFLVLKILHSSYGILHKFMWIQISVTCFITNCLISIQKKQKNCKNMGQIWRRARQWWQCVLTWVAWCRRGKRWWNLDSTVGRSWEKNKSKTLCHQCRSSSIEFCETNDLKPYLTSVCGVVKVLGYRIQWSALTPVHGIMWYPCTKNCCYINNLKPHLTSVRGVIWDPCSRVLDKRPKTTSDCGVMWDPCCMVYRNDTYVSLQHLWPTFLQLNPSSH